MDCGPRRLAGLVALFAPLLVVGLRGVPTAAQPATPTAVACDVPRRNVDDLIALLRSATPIGGPQEIERLPARQPADAATVAEIERAVRTLEACLNTGDQLIFFSFFSDRLVQDSFGADPASAMDLEQEFRAMAAATPAPRFADDSVSILGPWNVQLLADGRVIAGANLLPVEDRERGPFVVTALVFVRDGDRWLIDEPLAEFLWVEECENDVPAGYLLGLPPGYEGIDYYGEADRATCRLPGRDGAVTPKP